MGRIYKTPLLLRTCDAPGCELGADFTIKNDALQPVKYVCAKHAFLLKVGGMVVEQANAEEEQDYGEVTLGEDDDGKGIN